MTEPQQDEATQEEAVQGQPAPLELVVAQQDEQTAIHILGGFGVSVHKGDVEYATRVDERLGALAAINAEDVECMVCLVKVRRPDNKFDLVGATFGLEPELTALHMVLGARLRQLRAVIAVQIQQQMAEQAAKVEQPQEEVTNGEG